MKKDLLDVYPRGLRVFGYKFYNLSFEYSSSFQNVITQLIQFVPSWIKNNLLDIYPCGPRVLGYKFYSFPFKYLSYLRNLDSIISQMFFKNKSHEK